MQVCSGSFCLKMAEFESTLTTLSGELCDSRFLCRSCAARAGHGVAPAQYFPEEWEQVKEEKGGVK